MGGPAPTVSMTRQMAAERKTGWAVTAVYCNGRGIERIDRFLRGADPAAPVSAGLVDRALDEVRRRVGGQIAKTRLMMVSLDDAQVIIEPLVRPKTVCIFGAGHVAQPTAPANPARHMPPNLLSSWP